MRWTDILRVLTVFGLFTAMIAVAVAALGAWPVIPFTGLELLLLAGAFYLNAACRRLEVGAWLPEHERRRLARDLTRALGTSVS